MQLCGGSTEQAGETSGTTFEKDTAPLFPGLSETPTNMGEQCPSALNNGGIKKKKKYNAKFTCLVYIKRR